MPATRAFIHTQNFRHNLKQVRALVGSGKKICVALKADAYGHGALALARIALEEGASHLAVATLGEASDLREAGLTAPIVLYSLLAPQDWEDAIHLDIEPMVASETYIRGLSVEALRQGKVVGVHLNVDVGMGRIGCFPQDAPALAALIIRLGGLKLAGTCTHFPLADAADLAPTRGMMAQFQSVLVALRGQGIAPGFAHAANSGAIMAHSSSHLDMVRPGIMLYGYYPSPQCLRPCELKPVMELRSQIVFLKSVKAGTAISYGSLWRAPRDTVIGTVSAGYADGYNRLLSNKGKVLVAGRCCPVVGRVCMDQFMIDLGPHSHVRLFEEAVLFGPQEQAPTAEDLADLVGSIPYEITCRIDKRVPRLYLPSF